jgi:hypothetical protein
MAVPGPDDPDVAQARLMLANLWDVVGDTSRKLEALEGQGRVNRPTRSPVHNSRRAADLRRELYETHRLIDRINARFPGAAAFLRHPEQSAGQELT